MSHDENEQQHIKQTRQSIHLQSQPHKKGSPLGGEDNRGNTRIGVVGVSPTDIPRRWLDCLRSQVVAPTLQECRLKRDEWLAQRNK